MGKIDLVKIMVLENLIISVLTIAGGIVGGILFSKLGELLAAKILGSNAGLSMKISVPHLCYGTCYSWSFCINHASDDRVRLSVKTCRTFKK